MKEIEGVLSASIYRDYIIKYRTGREARRSANIAHLINK